MPRTLRGAQQTVSMNICLEDQLSPTIFGLKSEEKLEFPLAQIFEIWGMKCLLFSEREKRRFEHEKKASKHFR